MIKGKSEKMKKTKTVGGSPANLRLITLNNPCSILKKKPGTAMEGLSVIDLFPAALLYRAFFVIKHHIYHKNIIFTIKHYIYDKSYLS